MTSNKMSPTLIACLLASSAMPAFAQDGQEAAGASSDTMVFEEIVVTSRKRAESLQDVPVAVSAFSATQIEEAGIERPADFINMTPNISVAESQNPGISFITVRGISQVRNGESPVAVVVDGVLQTAPGQFNVDLFDIEQIEVLKGPQGALYGRNAIGGAINITTKKPAQDFEGKVLVGGGNGGLVKAQAAVSGGLGADSLAGRLTVSHKEYDGYLWNTYLRTEPDPYQDQNITGRIMWDPSASFSADIRANYDRTTSGAVNFVMNRVDAVSGEYTKGFSGLPGDADDVGPDIESNFVGRSLREIFGLSARLNWQGEFGSLLAISSYDSIYETSVGDAAPYTSALTRTQNSLFDTETYSQELRFTSPDENRFRYIVGVYYLETDRLVNRSNGTDLGQGIGIFPEVGSFAGANSDNPSVWVAQDQNDNKAYAAFLQTNFDVSERFELSAAVRYDRDERRAENVGPSHDVFSATLGVPGSVREANFSKWQPKFTLRYKFSDDLSAYATYSEGFRSGGFNQDGVAAVAAALDPDTLVQDSYGDETSRNWEVGFKGRALDRKLRVTGAAFVTKFEGFQFFSFIPAAGAQIITQIDEIDIQGAELEVHYASGTGLSLSGGLGYTNSEIKAYAIDPTAVGNESPYVPKISFNLAAQQVFELSNDHELIARVDWESRGSQYWEPLNATERSRLNLVNARLSFGDIGGKWKLSAWARNLLNKEYNSEYVHNGFAHRGLPRTYGVDLSYNF
ncbi:TonB-dependent receptor [Kordiimonas lipolytica]|uniref:TonB-dependent receptor n=1 Tax=Kordiimonas lipolytica TaxID=1662421 RepID=A0ABV8UE58_9PROT|nr:TonB-dependent receptor [Kordiimonas lipolytica]